MEYAMGARELPEPVLIRSPKDVHKLVEKDLAKSTVEILLTLYLNPELYATHIRTSAISGSMEAVSLEARCVFRDAMLIPSARYILVAHSHPFEVNVRPSSEDIEITINLKAGGVLLGVPLLDSIIVGPKGYYSFQDSGKVFQKAETYRPAPWLSMKSSRARKKVVYQNPWFLH